MKFRSRKRKLTRWQRFSEWLADQIEDIKVSTGAALLLLALLILFVLINRAHADEPQVVNRGGQVTCGCALGGAEGACAVTSDWVRLRGIKLQAEACGKELAVAKEQIAVREQLSAGYKAALALSQSSVADFHAALEARQRQVDALTKALAVSQPTSHSRVIWAVIGMAVGVAATVGVGYALRPAR